MRNECILYKETHIAIVVSRAVGNVDSEVVLGILSWISKFVDSVFDNDSAFIW